MCVGRAERAVAVGAVVGEAEGTVNTGAVVGGAEEAFGADASEKVPDPASGTGSVAQAENTSMRTVPAMIARREVPIFISTRLPVASKQRRIQRPPIDPASYRSVIMLQKDTLFMMNGTP